MRDDDAGSDPCDRPESTRGWRDLAFRVAFAVERTVDDVRGRWRRARGDAVVLPYLGFGDGSTLRIRGRVLRDLPVDPADPGDGPLTNLAAAVRRFASAEIAGARVAVRVADDAAATELVADGEGFLDACIVRDAPLAPGRWPVAFRVLDPAPDEDEEQHGEIVVPSPQAPFGVISDIDDTVLVSDATKILRVLARTLLQNVHERAPFPGVEVFYRALAERGAPFFYVSSSPWNLHGPLRRFLELHELPSGPLLLRDWGLDDGGHADAGHAGHKRAAIDAVFEAWPHGRFLLIGDSGQEDPEIYAQLVDERPERVLGILIRDVSGAARDRAVDALARTSDRAGVPFRRVADSADAARFAVAQGWLDEGALRRCEAAVEVAIPPTDEATGRG